MTNLIDFMKELVGKQVNFDNDVKYNGQCTQLVKKWCERNGWAIPNGGGEDAWGYRNFRNGFVFIKNTTSGIPETGDILVFSGGTGHVSVALPSDGVNLFAFGQNYTRTKKCSIEIHKNYAGIYGWLHWAK